MLDVHGRDVNVNSHVGDETETNVAREEDWKVLYCRGDAAEAS